MGFQQYESIKFNLEINELNANINHDYDVLIGIQIIIKGKKTLKFFDDRR